MKYKDRDDVLKQNPKMSWHHSWNVFEAQNAIDRLANKLSYTEIKKQAFRKRPIGVLNWFVDEPISYEDWKDIETLFIVCGVNFAARRIIVYPRPRLHDKSSYHDDTPWQWLDWIGVKTPV